MKSKISFNFLYCDWRVHIKVKRYAGKYLFYRVASLLKLVKKNTSILKSLLKENFVGIRHNRMKNKNNRAEYYINILKV